MQVLPRGAPRRQPDAHHVEQHDDAHVGEELRGRRLPVEGDAGVDGRIGGLDGVDRREILVLWHGGTSNKTGLSVVFAVFVVVMVMVLVVVTVAEVVVKVVMCDSESRGRSNSSRVVWFAGEEARSNDLERTARWLRERGEAAGHPGAFCAHKT
eukprot:364695-Chlamydomonas_euryale.AAC.1